MNEIGRILISCPDRPGIVAAVSKFLFEQGANIVHSDQHTSDPTGGTFFMRVEFQLANIEEKEEKIKALFAPLGDQFNMEWHLSLASKIKRLAIFVSKEEHALLELLWRRRSGDLVADIAMIISNHADLKQLATKEGIPFHTIPVHKDEKEKAEDRQIALMAGKVDLIVLARYMQIVTPRFIKHYPNKIINIHHSFLPAFAGGNPYLQAYERGVKLIGATAHYVTADLDAGPIVEQGIERVSHRYGTDELKRIGQYIERIVLAKAVIWHLEDRILVYGNKTIVFN
ncbi:MAG: formyltetrahydrofolate deformylase [Nitrospirae bacterium]|nr:formyltetrahydrofolate deformylase [Candidatus Troglogloeales bacterium]